MFKVHGVHLDPHTRRAWREGEELGLSRLEFDLLAFLMERDGKIVDKATLMREVWGQSFWSSTKTIDVHLGWLRRKLGDDPRSPTLITTHRGRGLRFEREA